MNDLIQRRFALLSAQQKNIPVGPGYTYVLTDSIIARTADITETQSWEYCSYPTLSAMRDIRFSPTGVGIAVGYKQVVRSTDGGYNWETVYTDTGTSTTTTIHQMSSVDTDGKGNWVATGVYGCNVLVSHDDGATWTLKHLSIMYNDSYKSDVVWLGGTTWVLLQTCSTGIIALSTDSGATWTAGGYAGFNAYGNNNNMSVFDGYVWHQDESRIMQRSLSGAGGSWTACGVAMSTAYGIYGRLRKFNGVYYGPGRNSSSSVIFMTTDECTTWSTVSTGTVAAISSANCGKYAVVGSTYGNIRYSADGINWINHGVPKIEGSTSTISYNISGIAYW